MVWPFQEKYICGVLRVLHKICEVLTLVLAPELVFGCRVFYFQATEAWSGSKEDNLKSS